MDIKIDYETALEFVQAEVDKEGPDHIYQRYDGECWNVAPNEDGRMVGSCLVGRALIGAGVEVEIFEEFGAEQTPAYELERVIDGLKITEKANHFLTRVQTAQDTGEPWGDAVAAGKRVIARLAYEDEFPG